MRHGYEVFHVDPHVAADFYVRALGFAVEGEAPAGASYVQVRRDDLSVGCSRWEDAPTTPRRPPHGSEIVLRVDDVRAELARVRASGWPVEDELQERPWGLTDFRVFDPTGQYIRVTSSVPEQR